MRDPWVGKMPGEGNSYSLQCSGLENSIDRGAWEATYHPWGPRVGHDWATFTFTFWRERCYQAMHIGNTYLSPHLATWWTSVWSTSFVAASCQCKAQWMRIPRWRRFCSMPQDSYRECARFALLSPEGKVSLDVSLDSTFETSLGLCSFWSCFIGMYMVILASFPVCATSVIGFPYWDLSNVSHFSLATSSYRSLFLLLASLTYL